MMSHLTHSFSARSPAQIGKLVIKLIALRRCEENLAAPSGEISSRGIGELFRKKRNILR